MNNHPEQRAGVEREEAQTTSETRLALTQPPAMPGEAIAATLAPSATVIDTRPVARPARVRSDGYAALDADFRAHHATNAARRPGPFAHYRLVYRYGYDLGADPRYRSAAWPDVEREARPQWEERNPGTWALFQETIRYAWDQARRLAEE